MGKAQEMVRHGCGRIVPANGLCGPCLERDRAASALVLSDSKARPKDDCDDWLPFEGGLVVGAPPTTLASGMTCTLRLMPFLYLRALELAIQSPGLAMLDLCNLRFGTLSANASQQPIPCAGVNDALGNVFRWRFDRKRPYRLIPGVGVELNLHNRSAASVLVRAALFCESAED